MIAFVRIVRIGMARRGLRSMALAAVVVALAAAGLSAAILVRADAQRAVDAAFASQGGPDLVVTADPRHVDVVERALAADARVLEVATPRRVVDAQAEIGNERLAIIVNGLDAAGDTGLNRPVLTAGRLPFDTMEIAMDAGVADETGLSLGDSVTVRTRSVQRRLTVVGLGYDFTDCFFPNCDPGRAWVVDQELLGLGGEPAALVAVDLRDTATADAVGRHLEVVAGDAVMGFNTWPDTRGDLLIESEFFGAFLGAFGVLALVASAVVIAGMITARTWSRRRILAQLRSLGYTRGQVTVALLVEHALIGVGGCVVGNLGAALIAPRLRIGALALIEGRSVGVSSSAMIGSTVIVLATIILATLLPALRSGRRDVVAALSDAPGIRVHGRWVGRFDLQRLPVPLSLGVRATFTRPVRASLCAVTVALAVMTSMVAASINRTMDKMLAQPELTGDPADATVEPAADVTAVRAARMLDGMTEVSGWFSVADDTATIEDRSVHVRAIGGDPTSAGYVIGGGQPLTKPGQAIAGYGLVDAMGWQIGQSVRLDFAGRPIEVTLVGWYRETEDSGQLLQVRMEDFLRVHDNTVPRYAVHRVPGTTRTDVASALARTFGDGARIDVNETDGEHLVPFRIALATMTVLIGAVALANLIAAAVIASRERTRRTGALRALGMTRGSMLSEAITASVVSIGAALVVGVPLGWLTERAIGDLLTGELGAGPGVTVGPRPSQLVSIVIVVACVAIAATALAARPVIRRPIPQLLQEAA